MILACGRFLLEPAGTHDVDALHELWTNPGVRKFLWDDVVIERQRAEDVVRQSIADWSSAGYGLWCVRDGGRLAGFVGFRRSDDGPELLYGLHPDYWGRGHATEVARCAIDFGFTQCGFDRIWAATDPPNLASIRVMEHLGMTFARQEIVHGLDTIFFVLPRPQRPAREELRR